jgi:hypothetical protein
MQLTRKEGFSVKDFKHRIQSPVSFQQGPQATRSELGLREESIAQSKKLEEEAKCFRNHSVPRPLKMRPIS